MVETEIQSNFYQGQIKDKLGKAEIDEKLVARVTGAKEVLRKQRPARSLGLFRDDDGIGPVHLLDLLQMFREHRPQAAGGSGGGD